MEPFVTHAGRAVPLRRSNVDTDQIIPAEYLKQVSRAGFGKGLFAAWREDPSFVLNQPQYEGATILVAGKDFGTGSSREHAVWALTDYGFRAVIAPRFGDIFRGNSTKAGLLPVVLPEAAVAALQDAVEAEPATEIVVDLDNRLVSRDSRDHRVLRDRRLHPLAADGGPGRHRPDPPPRRRHHRLRALPPPSSPSPPDPRSRF
jgi:3-isopropylmalate dehydratase, small subunit